MSGWSRIAFVGLLSFTFVLFVAPQLLFEWLQPLQVGKLTAAVGLIGLLADRLTGVRTRRPMSRITKLMLVLMALAVFSVPFSRWPGGSVEILTDFLLKSLVLFFLVANVVDTSERLQGLLWVMVLCGIVPAAVGVIEFVNEGWVPPFDRIAGYDAPLTTNPNDLATTAAIFLGFSIGLWRSARSRAARVTLAIAMLTFVLAIIVSFSRGGFLALLAIGFVLFVRLPRGKMVYGALAIALFCATLVAVPGYTSRLYSIVDNSAEATGSAEQRKETMLWSAKFILTHPVVGGGLGMNPLLVFDNLGHWHYVHSIYLEIGVDLGLPGLVVFTALAWRALRAMRTARRRIAESPEPSQSRGLVDGCELGLISFLVAGAFAPESYHYHYYYLAGLAVAVEGLTAGLALPAPATTSTGDRRLRLRRGGSGGVATERG